MSAAIPYEARPIKRRRATKDELRERYIRLIDLAYEHGPCSVRHLYYRAVVESVPGIDKTQSGYVKVQRGVLDLRRQGLIPYRLIVDSTRWRREPDTWNGLDEFLADGARTYRRQLWARSDYQIEVWAESESIAGTISETTYTWGLPLFVTRGQSSETFAWNAAQAWQGSDRANVVLYIGDHDPAGLEIEVSLRDKLIDFSNIEPIWVRVGVTWEQVETLDLPGGRPKKAYGYPLAVEAEALPPRLLIDTLDRHISVYADEHELAVIRAAEESEKEILMRMAEGVR